VFHVESLPLVLDEIVHAVHDEGRGQNRVGVQPASLLIRLDPEK
jgi:hypothetical protein